MIALLIDTLFRPETSDSTACYMGTNTTRKLLPDLHKVIILCAQKITMVAASWLFP